MSRAVTFLAVAAAIALAGTNAANAAPTNAVDFDCSEAFVCPKIFVPVCDQDGNKYSNLCMMQSEQCKDGKERIETECPASKRKSIIPLSADVNSNDFYGEGGEDELPKLAPNGMGRIATTTTNIVCPGKCYKIFAPVCACIVKDGVASEDCFKFSNQCMFDSYACKTEGIEWKPSDCAAPAVAYRSEEEAKNFLTEKYAMAA